MNSITIEEKYSINPVVQFEFITPANKSFFFGYYNYSPINNDHSKLLAHRANFEGRMANPDDTVEIGYFDLITSKWNPIGTSNAFNWQQGAMLQWLGRDYNNRIIYNDVENGKFVSRIFDLKNRNFQTIPHPIYGVTPCGQFSISLNFERCYWTRAYSYASIRDENWNERIPEMDGILKIDLTTGKAKTIISINDILNFEGTKDDGHTSHWFEHIMLNPDGNRFVFYHRYGTNENYIGKVYSADLNGNDIWPHPYQYGDSLSHLGWINNHSYVLFTYPETKILSKWKAVEAKNNNNSLLISIYRKLLKPFIPRKIAFIALHKKDFYAITEDKKGIIGRLDIGMLGKDGHPSFTKDGQFMLTDTYTDELGFRHLILYHLKTSKIHELGKFYSTYNACGWRADLHPRFSPDEQSIIIDSTHNGYHQLVVLKLDWNMLI